MEGVKMQLGFEIDQAYEEEFAHTCEMISMYQPTVRTTLDGEWEEDELREDVYDMCITTMTSDLLKKYEFRALKDTNLLKPHYMAEHILNQIEDVIELYNKEYDKHRNEKCFGIIWYDKIITKMINKELKENVVK